MPGWSAAFDFRFGESPRLGNIAEGNRASLGRAMAILLLSRTEPGDAIPAGDWGHDHHAGLGHCCESLRMDLFDVRMVYVLWGNPRRVRSRCRAGARRPQLNCFSRRKPTGWLYNRTGFEGGPRALAQNYSRPLYQWQTS